MVDRYLSPLVDIVAVYIPRELNGLLKGVFNVTCRDRHSADRLYDMLKEPDKHGELVREAVEWIRCIQKTEHKVERVRVDIHPVPNNAGRRVPAFALTASAEVGDTKMKKYFDHLCSYSFKHKQPHSEAPICAKIFDTPWETCHPDRRWLNLDSNDAKFDLRGRRLWTVEFPSAEKDVDALYNKVDFKPFDILDEYTQPYTQPVFDHIWFCKCDEAFQGALTAGTRVKLKVISSDTVTPSADKMKALPNQIDLHLFKASHAPPLGRHVLSSFAPGARSPRLKPEVTGVLLYSGIKIETNKEVFPVRLDCDHSIHFLFSDSFEVMKPSHVRIIWQPPALPEKLFDSESKKEPFCVLKITRQSVNNEYGTSTKASREMQRQSGSQENATKVSDFIRKCKSIFSKDETEVKFGDASAGAALSLRATPTKSSRQSGNQKEWRITIQLEDLRIKIEELNEMRKCDAKASQKDKKKQKETDADGGSWGSCTIA
jgi:hypothetical protein